MKAGKQMVTGGPKRGRSQEKVLLALVVPTRNEAENILELVRENLSDLDYRVVHLPCPDRYRPRRLPQTRTNARWTNSLAVPIVNDDHALGVVFATRKSTEPFTEEDLNWLTAYVSKGPGAGKLTSRSAEQAPKTGNVLKC